MKFAWSLIAYALFFSSITFADPIGHIDSQRGPSPTKPQDPILNPPQLSTPSLADSFMGRVNKLESDLTNEAEKAKTQLQKTLPEIQRRTSNAIADERAKLEQLQHGLPLGSDYSQIRLKSASSIAWIEAQAVNVHRMANQSEAFLELDQVRRQLAPESEQFLRDQINSGREMMKFAQENSHPAVSQLAFDIVQAVHKFTYGLASGLDSGFYDLGQTVLAVYEQPSILKKIAKDLIETVKHPGQALVALEGALIDFAVTMAHGTAEEKGHALGKFAADLVLGIATDGVASAAIGPVKTALRGIISEPLATALGTEFRNAALVKAEISTLDAQLGTEVSHLFGKSKVGRGYNALTEAAELPIHSDHAKNFKGGRFWETKPQAGETFYRVGKPDDPNGFYWSRTKPRSEIQTRIDLAMPFSSDFSKVLVFTVPDGMDVTFFEGLIGTQGGRLHRITEKGASNIFVGNSGQVFIPEGLLKSESFKANVMERKIIDL